MIAAGIAPEDLFADTDQELSFWIGFRAGSPAGAFRSSEARRSGLGVDCGWSTDCSTMAHHHPQRSRVRMATEDGALAPPAGRQRAEGAP
jgi:hypothetical protein